MSKPFEIGERVAVYDNALRWTGQVDLVFRDAVKVVLKGGTSVNVHPNQCRRLVKPKRREWFIVVTKGKDTPVSAYKFMPEWPDFALFDYVRVREVRTPIRSAP